VLPEARLGRMIPYLAVFANLWPIVDRISQVAVAPCSGWIARSSRRATDLTIRRERTQAQSSSYPRILKRYLLLKRCRSQIAGCGRTLLRLDRQIQPPGDGFDNPSRAYTGTKLFLPQDIEKIPVTEEMACCHSRSRAPIWRSSRRIMRWRSLATSSLVRLRSMAW